MIARVKPKSKEPPAVRLECFGRACSIVDKGPEQSEIKFADDGSRRFVVNEWIKTARERKQKQRDSIKGRPWEKRFRK